MPSGATGGGSTSASRRRSRPPHSSMTMARIPARLPPPLPSEHVRGEGVDAVEEEQPVEVVELVLEAACLEPLGPDRAAVPLRLHGGRPAHVRGQLVDAQAALATDLRAF